MSNADRQVLSAIKRNPYPADSAVTLLAGVVEGLLDAVVQRDDRIRKLETLVETLIEEQIEAVKQ